MRVCCITCELGEHYCLKGQVFDFLKRQADIGQGKIMKVEYIDITSEEYAEIHLSEGFE